MWTIHDEKTYLAQKMNKINLKASENALQFFLMRTTPSNSTKWNDYELYGRENLRIDRQFCCVGYFNKRILLVDSNLSLFC